MNAYYTVFFLLNMEERKTVMNSFKDLHAELTNFFNWWGKKTHSHFGYFAAAMFSMFFVVFIAFVLATLTKGWSIFVMIAALWCWLYLNYRSSKNEKLP